MQNAMFNASSVPDTDRIARMLHSIGQYALIITLGLLPIVFVPIAYAPFTYSKTLFVITGVVLALIFFSLSILRSGRVALGAPWGLIALWCLTAVYAVSTLFSGDIKDALIGDGFEVHTAAFMLLLATVASSVAMLRGTKLAIVRLYGLIIISGFVLGLFHMARLLMGPEVLTFGIFTTQTATPLGSWNGLALYFGLVVLISLVALEQLPLTKIGKIVLGISSFFALVMLMVVNYLAVWVILGVVSLVMLIYGLTRKHYPTTTPLVDESSNRPFAATLFATIVLIASLLFIFGGATLGTIISERTGISYVEVRPSTTATFDIARNVLSESPIIGIGPNKFADAWRLYKDPSINQTIFWNSSFDTGSGFIPTSFVTTGLLGMMGWALFFILLFVHGFKMLFRTERADRFWMFIGTSAFVASVYLWGMSFIYTPPTAILLLAAVCTGIFFAAYTVLVPQRWLTFSVASSRAVGVVLIGMVVVVIFASVGALYVTAQHYSALYTFNKAFATLTEEDTIDTLQDRITVAYDRSSNDIFARQIAQYRLAQMNALLGLEEPTAEQQASFQTAVAEGVNTARIATEIDPSEPQNWIVLGQFFSGLAFANVDGAYDRAREAFERAATFDPVNPEVVLLQAQLESRANNLDDARTLAEDAVAMKRNYTDALLFLSQLDIAANDVPAAIARTESVISIEPENPARYYQLGILESSADNTPRAIAAFERAIELDNDYANARYFLALSYASVGRNTEALAQLRAVLALNPGNQDIETLITRLENGESIVDPQGATTSTGTGELADGEEVNSRTIGETSLVSPVNVVPNATSTSGSASTE